MRSKIFREIKDVVMEGRLWKQYSGLSGRLVSSSVQSKPIFGREEFSFIMKNKNFLKFVVFGDDGDVEGLAILVKELADYPVSHYSEEYFKRKDYSNLNCYFLVGDLCGFSFKQSFVNRLNDSSLNFDSLIYQILDQLKLDEKPVMLVGNYSDRSSQILGYNFLNERTGKCPEAVTVTQLDKEIFVSIRIRWADRLKFSLVKRIISFWLSAAPVGGGQIDYEGYTKLFCAGDINLFRSQSLTEFDVGACQDIYKSRLSEGQTRSPQKLQYDDNTFASYLRSHGYVKYILKDKQGVVGLFILISADNKDCADWVAKENRLADGYVKLVLSRPGTPSLYFILLSCFSLLDFCRTIRKTKVTILADYSENINGQRFNHDLGVEKGRFFRLVRKNKLLAESLTILLRPHSVVIDKDYYITYTSK